MLKDYIIVATMGADQTAFVSMLDGHGVTMIENFAALECHYHITCDDSLVGTLLGEATVASLEEDQIVVIMSTQAINVSGSGAGDNWGLSRVCKRNEWEDTTWYPNSGSYDYFRDGSNVDVYVIDTGARITHTDFTGRIEVVYDHYLNSGDAGYGVDLQGHGTHVASTIAGTKYGIAKGAHIKVVRVFETGGAALSAIIAGVNAALAHHQQKVTDSVDRPSIVNMSLGGGANASEETAVNACIDAGMVVVAAAGNDGKNLDSASYNVHPAEITRAITVGSVDIQDKMSSFSNYGSIVDVFAPGHYITAAGTASDSAERMLSGTSMAAPHVAGVAALYCEDKSRGAVAIDVALVHDWIVANATPSSLALSAQAVSKSTPNLMLYSDYVTSNVAGALPGSTDPISPDSPGGSDKPKKAWRGGGKKTVKANAYKRFEKLIAALTALVASPAVASAGVSAASMTGLLDDLEYYVGQLLAGNRKESYNGYFGLLGTIDQIKGLLNGDYAILNKILADAGMPIAV